jgi:hypothetical protein
MSSVPRGPDAHLLGFQLPIMQLAHEMKGHGHVKDIACRSLSGTFAAIQMRFRLGTSPTEPRSRIEDRSPNRPLRRRQRHRRVWSGTDFGRRREMPQCRVRHCHPWQAQSPQGPGIRMDRTRYRRSCARACACTRSVLDGAIGRTRRLGRCLRWINPGHQRAQGRRRRRRDAQSRQGSCGRRRAGAAGSSGT